MDIEYKYSVDKDVLIAKITGTYIISDDTGVVRQVINKLKEHDCSRLLFDFRDAKFVVETLPAYDRPRVLEDIGVKRLTKFASVFREFNEDACYTESVYRNRGWRMRNFSDFDEAIEWLTKP